LPKLYVVRHAEPEITGVLLGRTNPALSPAGRQAARDRLGGLRVDRVYTSPLRRCAETAEQINASVLADENLCEIHLGEWDGLSWAEIEERYPELAALKAKDWFGVTPPGGEPWASFAARVTTALRRAMEAYVPAAIVAHVAVNAVIAQALTGADPAAFNQPYCGVMEFEFGEVDIEGLCPKNT
jgi:alpha-ribazole phosphatase